MHATTSDPSAADPREAAPAASRSGLQGLARYTYWSLVGAVLILLVMPTITGPVPRPPDPLGTAAVAAVLLVAVAVARLTERHIPRRLDAPPLSPRQWRVWAVVGSVAALVVATVAVLAGDVFFWAFAPAVLASLLIRALPPRQRRLATGGVIAAAAAAGAVITLLQGEQAAYPVSGALVTAFVVFLTLGSVWTWDVAVQLDAARRKAATLAVANERLRFAADLHDIQGHHLQVIALKSELAGRLVRRDPDAAERELRMVHELAADALRDTRAVVHGYRRATLEAEIANASNVLASAGIDARLHDGADLQADTLSEDSRHLLGLVLREAVTNVLRHSTATHADVTLERDGERIRLEVSNDGAEQAAPTRAGGLRDLAERLRAAGGTLTWAHGGERFYVRAELPAAAPGPADDAALERRGGGPA